MLAGVRTKQVSSRREEAVLAANDSGISEETVLRKERKNC